MLPAAGGIWSERPRERKLGRRGGRGVVGGTASASWSSLLCTLSRKVGDGWSACGGSERERDFEGVLLGESAPVGGGRCIEVFMIAMGWC